MIDTPKGQAQILGGVEFTLIEQKFLPARVTRRDVAPLGQWPDQAFAHGMARLFEKFQFTRSSGRDGQGQLSLIESGTEGPGGVIPLPIQSIAT
ncbi:hypothetical protein D3C76_1682540 [compost metagenome]